MTCSLSIASGLASAAFEGRGRELGDAERAADEAKARAEEHAEVRHSDDNPYVDSLLHSFPTRQETPGVRPPRFSAGERLRRRTKRSRR